MKLQQQGYFSLPTGKGIQQLHFGANCWYNLLEATGKEADKFGAELQAEFNGPMKKNGKPVNLKHKANTLNVLNLLTDLAWAAAKAHDQENDNEITYNRFKVRDWMAKLTPADSTAFVAAMTNSVDVPLQTTGK